MHRVCKWCIITALIAISKCCKVYSMCWIQFLPFLVYWILYSLIFQLALESSLNNSTVLFSAVNLAPLHSIPLHPAGCQILNLLWKTLVPSCGYFSSAFRSDRSGGLWGEVLSDSWTERGLVGPVLQSFERGYELRQHQTRIKSTNQTDPGWPGGLLTTLWREEYLACWGGDMTGGNVWQMNEGRYIERDSFAKRFRKQPFAIYLWFMKGIFNNKWVICICQWKSAHQLFFVSPLHLHLSNSNSKMTKGQYSQISSVTFDLPLLDRTENLRCYNSIVSKLTEFDRTT